MGATLGDPQWQADVLFTKRANPRTPPPPPLRLTRRGFRVLMTSMVVLGTGLGTVIGQIVIPG